MRALASYKKIVVLTGAGISHAAGLATYRGPEGLWNDPKKMELAELSALETRRDEVTEMFWSFREQTRRAEPTRAHAALVAFEQQCAGAFLIVTQNIDGLHQRAGSQHVVEYHGNLAHWRCEICGRETDPPTGTVPLCDGQAMRPDIIFFGEAIPVSAEREVKAALRECDLFVAIGTSGTVWPAAAFVRSASYAGARTILLNLELDDEARTAYSEVHAGPAEDLVPTFFG
ncbi:NAD-dependent protein deacylase [soil metagenome]